MVWSKRWPMLVLAHSATVGADPIPIPNFSFELPPVERNEKNPFGALPFIDNWDETAVGEVDEFDQNTGVFLNTEAGAADHITNAHLDRLGFISSLTGNGVRQALDDTYLPGRSYTFTISVGKSSFFPVGDTEPLEVALFYFEGGSEEIITSTLVFGIEVGTTALADVTVTSPIVEEEDLWAGQPIGVLVRPSATDPDDEGGEGFWNVDYARLLQSALPSADVDGDTDVDLSDFAVLQNCFSDAQEVSGACSSLDLNSDLVIDLDDFWLFRDNFSGPVG